MPDADPNVLEHLRGLFRAELEDQIAAMQVQLTEYTTSDATQATRQVALQELYRAVHSLKGAAGAVNLQEPANICHALEDELALFRSGELSEDPVALERSVRASIEALTRWAESQPSRPETLPEAPEPLSEHRPSDSSPPLPGNESIRVSIQSLDRVLTGTDDWLISSHASSIADDDQGDILDGLTTLLDEAQASEDAEERTRLGRIVRRTLSNLKNRQRQQRLARQHHERSLLVHGTDVARQLRSLRLQPLGSLLRTLEQAAYEIAKSDDKQIDFIATGAEAQADYAVIERLREPLLQLVRNAVAHGIEGEHRRRTTGKSACGTVRVDIAVHGTELSIVVEDDGQGIPVSALRAAAMERGLELPEQLTNAAMLELVCVPGLSTRGHADHHAGRGIGMDLVRDRIEHLQGRMRLDSRDGEGTRVELEVPVDMSLLEALLLRAGDELLTIPTAAIVQLRRVSTRDLVFVDGRPFLQQTESLIGVSDFRQAFEGARKTLDHNTTFATVVLEAGGATAAYAADELLAVGEYVVKPLPERSRVPLAQAAVVLPDGRVAPLMNAQALCIRTENADIDFNLAQDETTTSRPRVLVVDDSVTTRQLVRILLEAAGYLVETAGDGEQAWARLKTRARFDAVVTDIDMPEVTGFELLARVRSSARFRELPVLMVTALEQDEDRRRALDLGADAYVSKSTFDQQQLLDALKELIG